MSGRLSLSSRFAMKSVLLLLVFSSLFVIGYSAIFQERQRVVPGHENECFDKEENIFYKKGEEMKWKLKMCGRKLCKGSQGKAFVYAEIQTCGKVDLPPECHTEVKLHLTYPDCCEQIVCPESLLLEKNKT